MPRPVKPTILPAERSKTLIERIINKPSGTAKHQPNILISQLKLQT